MEGQIQEQAAAEVEASPEVTEVESTPEVEALEDSATPTELEANDESVEEYDLELVLEDEEEESSFDWTAYESGSGARGEEHKNMEGLYEATLVTSVEHQVVSGVVVQMTDRDVIIDISSK